MSPSIFNSSFKNNVYFIKMFEQLIRERVHFTKHSSTGFNQCVCNLCHDYTDRGGFKFENGNIVYNCFNCSFSIVHDETSKTVSNKFRKVLNSFGISKEEISDVLNAAFFNQDDSSEKTISIKDVLASKEDKNYLVTPEVDLPKGCFELGSTNQGIEIQEKIVDYLHSRRIDFTKHKFFFSLNKDFMNYVIVPFYRNGKLIFWQGRNFNNNCSKKERYSNCTKSKENIFFNFDLIFKNTKTPLFVSEGIFDALSIDECISSIGSKLPEAKIEILKKSKRDIIFIIDKDKNGKLLAEKVLSNGWKITFSPEGTSDVNDSITKFGKCWTVYQLFKNIPRDRFAADLAIGLNCY